MKRRPRAVAPISFCTANKPGLVGLGLESHSVRYWFEFDTETARAIADCLLDSANKAMRKKMEMDQ